MLCFEVMKNKEMKKKRYMQIEGTTK